MGLITNKDTSLATQMLRLVNDQRSSNGTANITTQQDRTEIEKSCNRRRE